MPQSENPNDTVLQELAALIASRRTASTDKSYTARLLSAGVEKCAEKFGEEAVETIIALTTGRHENIKAEAADALYHLLVALEAANVPFDEVLTELKNRTSQSGIDEKTSRTVKS
jgi:phosphoribosyl-ATP pyrophosphohydrolase